jgi:hypothetical protein
VAGLQVRVALRGLGAGVAQDLADLVHRRCERLLACR